MENFQQSLFDGVPLCVEGKIGVAVIFTGGLLGLIGSGKLFVVALTPVAAVVLAGGLLRLVGSAQLLVMPLAPIAAVILAGDFLGGGLLAERCALGVFDAGDGAGGLLQ